MEGLDLPAYRVPLELLDGFLQRGHGQIGNKMPVDFVFWIGRIGLDSVDPGQHLGLVTLLLADRRQSFDGGELDLQLGRPAAFSSNIDLVCANPCHLCKARADTVRLTVVRAALCGKPVCLRAHKELRVKLLA